jgi:hypothetical protein
LSKFFLIVLGGNLRACSAALPGMVGDRARDGCAPGAIVTKARTEQGIESK